MPCRRCRTNGGNSPPLHNHQPKTNHQPNSLRPTSALRLASLKPLDATAATFAHVASLRAALHAAYLSRPPVLRRVHAASCRLVFADRKYFLFALNPEHSPSQMLVKLARDCAENKNIPQIANALIINAKRNSNLKILLDAVNAAVLLHLMANTLKPNKEYLKPQPNQQVSFVLDVRLLVSFLPI
ncbi:hypothetical protein BCR33DRAFT_733819 [Rhizoclosmatium globosum]|uniref:Uncharacterized protein n=1 Tax=Rhizoclosmatium globosum TaxID=329046 RepID=A0A1Y2CYX3_9FUNG|nr:hypothetical protein BCR33DRAFT_733819 [Rhizoclosmatium globosum]|eukprot:ORY51545.1 hypothetical protein BCR33DRAFT_733819 [Rhizoclosmatium globosum]